jgi:hypothetical protein
MVYSSFGPPEEIALMNGEFIIEFSLTRILLEEGFNS